jgi:hypothetical protein
MTGLSESEIEKIAEKVIDRLGDEFEKHASLTIGRGVWKMFVNAMISACLVFLVYGATQGWFKQ